MKENTVPVHGKGNLNRRTVVKNGAALVGAGLLGFFINVAAEQKGAITNNIFNVKNFGATGNRIEGYCSQMSVTLGDTLRFFVSTNPPSQFLILYPMVPGSFYYGNIL